MRSGISLIDVIAAIAVGGIMTVILYRSVAQTNRVVFTIDAIVDMYSEVALFKDRMERDVLGAFVPQGVSMEFYKEVMQRKNDSKPKPADKKKPKQDKDTDAIDEIFVLKKGTQNNLSMMTFTTTNPLIVFNEVTPRAVRVLYELVPQEGQNRWSLVRYEGTELGLKTYNKKRKEGAIRGYTILDNIKKLAVRCVVESRNDQKKEQAAEGENKERTFEYLFEWDDTIAEERGSFLPLYVEVKGEVVDGKKKRSVPFTFMVPIKATYFKKRFKKAPGIVKQSPGKRQARTGRGPTLGSMAKRMNRQGISPQGSKLFEGAVSAMRPRGRR